MLKSARDSAVKARTQAANLKNALVVTAQTKLRATLDGHTTIALASWCRNFRSSRLDDPETVAKYALRSLARRYGQLGVEVQDLESEVGRLTQSIALALINTFGVGPDTAATLLIAAGSNTDRLRSEATLAFLCGVNPTPASSGKTNRHRPTATVTVNRMPLSIALSWSGYSTSCGPRHTWADGSQRY